VNGYIRVEPKENSIASSPHFCVAKVFVNRAENLYRTVRREYERFRHIKRPAGDAVP
jgi:hypothetical protein